MIHHTDLCKLKEILIDLKKYGCIGVKISFEDEGALLDDAITIRYITASLQLLCTVKISGAEAKKDIAQCNALCADKIVAPMIETDFALTKFIKAIETYQYSGQIGYNLETITAYHQLYENKMDTNIKKIDFITVGRTDFVQSMQYNNPDDFIHADHPQLLEYCKNIFRIVKEKKCTIKCCLGGTIQRGSK